MRFMTMASVLGLAIAGACVGCDDEIATERTVDVKGDKVITEEKTVSETPSGGVKVTEEKKVDEIDK